MRRRGRRPVRWRGSKSTAPAYGTASSRSSPRWGRSARWATRPRRCRCTTRSVSRRRERRGAGCPRRSWWSGCARRRTAARWRPSAVPRSRPGRRWGRRSDRGAPAWPRRRSRARAGVRAGMSGREADALARDPIAARGFGEAFGHSLGHGLGLEVHEAPRLSRTNDNPLPAGAVVTIEPGVYLAGDGGVRIEDDVHLAAAGPELLSDGLTDLLELV